MKRYIGLILVGLLLLTACEVEIRRVEVEVTPEEVTLAPGETQDFTASTTSERETDFSWRADGGRFDNSVGETITYTAPEEEGEYTVRARPTNGGNDFIEGRATVTVSLTEEVEPVTANTDAGAPVGDEVTLEPDEIVVFEVTVPVSTSQAGSALYIELSEELDLSVYDEERTLFASSNSADQFARGDSGLSAAGVDAQAITVSSRCRGSCVIQDAEASTFYAKVKNTSNDEVSFSLYAFVQDYSDGTEPDNNQRADIAPTLAQTESGAIESLGDEDFFRVTTDGTLFFTIRPNVVIDLKADIVDALGEKIADAPADRGVEVQAGDYVKIYVPSNDEAAAASRSGYDLEIQ